MKHGSPVILIAALVAGLAGGLLGSYLFSSTPAYAQRDWSLPEQPPAAAVVPAQGFLFRTPGGQVVAKLEGGGGGTVLTLLGERGAQVRIGAGTGNAVVHVEADSRNIALLSTDPGKAELLLQGGGRNGVSAEVRQGGGTLLVNGRPLAAGSPSAGYGTPAAVPAPAGGAQAIAPKSLPHPSLIRR